MKRTFFLIVFVVLLIAGGVFTFQLASRKPTVPVARIALGPFEDQVTTNGRVEPSAWASARAEREGLILSVPVVKGQMVAKGAPLAVLDSREAQADLATAQARIEEARSLIATLEAGGRRRELVDIEESLKQRRADQARLEKELAAAQRLLAKNAATREEVRVLSDRLDALKLEIEAIAAKKPALVSPADLVSARARLREAESAATLARRRIELSTINAPVAGMVYQLDAKPGTYVAPGALIANVGTISSVKVLVYVDEPELGRVSRGMPVEITWDALEGRKWKGAVDKTPTQIIPLGTRQVGEVECLIDNSSGELLPGTNVNIHILTRQQANALLIPKEGLRQVNGVTGAYKLVDGKLQFVKVTLGASNVTNAIVTSGLSQGDMIVLGPDAGLHEGLAVDTEAPKPKG